MNRARIILLCIGAAITYGILHDQVTARLCIEYFTVAHPPLFSATSPTMVGLCWGVAATAPIGAILGILLAIVAEVGYDPPLTASRLIRPVARLLGTMAFSALVAGMCGYFLAQRGAISLPASLAEYIPQWRHHHFMAVWFAHGVSYLVGLSGGGWLVFRVWQARDKPVALSVFPRTPGAALRAAIVLSTAAYIFWIRFGTR